MTWLVSYLDAPLEQALSVCSVFDKKTGNRISPNLQQENLRLCLAVRLEFFLKASKSINHYELAHSTHDTSVPPSYYCCDYNCHASQFLLSMLE